jgi:hypothetical protein
LSIFGSQLQIMLLMVDIASPLSMSRVLAARDVFEIVTPSAPLYDDCYELFVLRSAQRFFIARDSRFLPSGVIRPRSFPLDEIGC